MVILLGLCWQNGLFGDLDENNDEHFPFPPDKTPSASVQFNITNINITSLRLSWSEAKWKWSYYSFL